MKGSSERDGSTGKARNACHHSLMVVGADFRSHRSTIYRDDVGTITALAAPPEAETCACLLPTERGQLVEKSSFCVMSGT